MNNIKGSHFLILFAITFIGTLIVYGFELTHFTLSIDEEWPDNFYHTIGIGRWGHAFLRKLIFPEPYSPFFTTLVALFFLSLAATYSAIISKVEIFSLTVFSLIYVSFPQFAYQLEFSNQAETVSFGLFISTFASYLFLCGGQKLFSFKSLTTILLFVFSIAIYQSLFFLPLTLALMYTLFSLDKGDDSTKSSLILLGKFVILLALSLIVYFLLTPLIQQFFGIISKSSHFEGMIGWQGNIRDNLDRIFHAILPYFSFRSFYGFNVFPVVGIATSIFILKKIKNGGASNIWQITVALLFIFSPFFLILILANPLPPRAMTSLSAVMAGMLTILEFKKSRPAKIVLCSILLAIGCRSSSQLFFSDYMQWKNDTSLANRIVTTIYIKYPEFNAQKNKIYFYGNYGNSTPWKKENSDVFGSSFFAWDGGNNRRIMSFMNLSGISNFMPQNKMEIPDIMEQIQNLPSWPNSNAIKMFGDVLIVKLGEKPGID